MLQKKIFLFEKQVLCLSNTFCSSVNLELFTFDPKHWKAVSYVSTVRGPIHCAPCGVCGVFFIFDCMIHCVSG